MYCDLCQTRKLRREFPTNAITDNCEHAPLHCLRVSKSNSSIHNYSDLRMTLKNGFGKCSLFVLAAVDEMIKTWPLRFPAKEKPNIEKALFDWPLLLHYDIKAKYLLISRKFSGMKFFDPSVHLTNQQPRVFVSVR